MKTVPDPLAELCAHREAEAARFNAKAKDVALAALHKSADGRSINEQDPRLIRDHEIRAEVFATAATMGVAHLPLA
jgi:hypothetical protein